MFQSLPGRAGIYCMVLLLVISLKANAQSPGMIVKRATGAGVPILDPNNDGFSSASPLGFTGSDVDTAKTEIKYRVIRPLNYEPTSDLLRGPSTGFSDLVTSVDSSGFYIYSDGTRLYFRLRLGGYIPGSKGYTILVDTDAKIGYSGANADPGYTSPGNGRAGNPGFEFEISFQTNFRVAIYNVDTPGKVVLKYSNIPVTDYSQVSVALSYTSGNPDYFMDFYVPFSQLGINANTPLRFAVTTVMAPLPALGGPMSDIFGFGNIKDYMDAWTQVVTYQTPVTPATLNLSTYVPVCTAPPTVNAPAVGSIGITGTWTRLDVTKQNTAEIYLYRNALLIDNVTATSGIGWTIPVTSVAAGDEFYARAQASDEGNCFQSGKVIAIKCSGPISARPTATCATVKGIDGTYPVSGSRIRVYQSVLPGNPGTASFSLYADSTIPPGNFNTILIPFVLHDKTSTPPQWKMDGMEGNGNPSSMANSACTGGSSQPDMPVNTTLAVTVQEPGKCESMPLFTCPNGTLTSTPIITAVTLYAGSAIAGTAPANSYMRLYVDSLLRGIVYADAGGNYSFSSPGLTTGSKVELFAQSASTCVSSSVTRTVQAYTTPPVITTDNSGYVLLGATSITGTSTEVNGTIVFLDKRVGAVKTFMGQTTVTNGSWTLSSIPATAATDIYVATQRNPVGALSDSSNLALVPSATTTSCASFASATYPANASTVTGTISPALTNGKVYLYIDEALADSATGVTTAFTINVHTTPFNTIYAGAVLMLTAKTFGGSEKLGCASNTAAVTCSSIQTPLFTLSPPTIAPNATTTANVTNTVSGLLYTLIHSPDDSISYGSAAFATGTSLSLPSYAFITEGIYPLTVRALNLGEGSSCITTAAMASLLVSSTSLPVHLISFKARVNQHQQAYLEWAVYDEKNMLKYSIERSSDAQSFSRIAYVMASGSDGGASTYSYTDPETLSGTTWYRLSMIGSDGKISYSPVVFVSAAKNADIPAIMPSPFQESIIITRQITEPGESVVRLIDMVGRTCAQRSYQLSTGFNKIMLSELGSLSPGIYMLEILQEGKRVWIQRVEKQ